MEDQQQQQQLVDEVPGLISVMVGVKRRLTGGQRPHVLVIEVKGTIRPMSRQLARWLVPGGVWNPHRVLVLV